MGDDDTGIAVELQDRVQHLERGFRIQACRGLIYKKHGGLAQQCTGDGDALAFAAGESGAVLAAEIISAFFVDQPAKPRQANCAFDLLLRELGEHSDVVPDRAVEHEHVLLDDGDEIVEGVCGNLLQLFSVVKDLASIVVGRGHQQVQDRGLAASGATHERIATAGFHIHIDVVKHGLAFLIGKAQITDLDAFCKFRFDGFALVRDIFAERLGQFVNEAVC